MEKVEITIDQQNRLLKTITKDKVNKDDDDDEEYEEIKKWSSIAKPKKKLSPFKSPIKVLKTKIFKEHKVFF